MKKIFTALNKKRLLLGMTLAFVPLFSFAGDPGDATERIGNVDPLKPYVSSLKFINIPTITCRLLNIPSQHGIQAHTCLVDLPDDATITNVVAYRRDSMEIYDGVHSSISLHEMEQGGGASLKQIGAEFTLKASDKSEQLNVSAFNAQKNQKNAFFVHITDHGSGQFSLSPVPGEPPPPSNPYSYGRSGVQMVSVGYK